MGFLKRIFGSGTPESDKKTAAEIRQVQSNPDSKLYPVLKPGNWVGIKGGCFYQTVLGTKENPELVMAFAYNMPNNFVFLNKDDIADVEPAKVLGTAIGNLEEFPVQYDLLPQLNNKVMTCSGTDFSSEKILDKQFMIKVQEVFQSAAIIVSIPRRTTMLIAAGDAGEKLIGKMTLLHNKIWKDDSYGNAPIMNGMFIVRDGKIANYHAFPE
jgi:hypothetical protein